jgi:hypothetical protein
MMTTVYQLVPNEKGRKLTLESLFGIQIDLLCLCDLFQDILNHNSIIHSYVPIRELIHWSARSSLRRCKLDMVIRLNDVYVQFPIRRRDEDSLIYTKLTISYTTSELHALTHLFYTRSIQFSKGTHDSSLMISLWTYLQRMQATFFPAPDGP